MNKRVLTVGEVNIDIILSGLAAIPKAEQDTLAQSLDTVVGGQTGTIARALSRLGIKVLFVGRVGDDDHGRMAIGQLAADGVDTSGVVVDPTVRTGVTVVLSTGTERAYATYLGSISQARRADITPQFLQQVDHLHVGSYFLQRELHPEIRDLFREAKRLGLTTSTDPGWDSFNEWDAHILDVLPYVDVFLPNEVEAMTITRLHSTEEAAAALVHYGGTVVVKMGGKGCLVANRQGTFTSPALAVPVADVTSAGDVFNAGFLYGFLAGWDLRTTARFANACGSIAVSKVGSTGIIQGAAQVHEFLASHTA